jgi:opacity protein-like surface antigen
MSSLTMCMRRLLIALCLMTASVMAQDTEVMNQENLEYRTNRGTNFILYFRTRYNVDQSHLFQVKPGVIVEQSVGKNLTGLVGYYNQTEWRKSQEDYTNFHRYWGGARYIFFRRNHNILEGRQLLEVFQYPENGSVKVRNRSRIWWERRDGFIVPSASYEYLRFQNTNTSRINFMLSHNFDKHLTVGVGYEARQMPATGDFNNIAFTLVRYHIK